MKLSDICDVYSGYALKQFNNEKNGLPVIKIGNILTDGNLSLAECQYSEETVNEKYYSKYGDIYVALSGATTGKIGIMQSTQKHIINQRVGIVRKRDDNISESYIKYFLLRQTDRILKEASGCAQPNISPKQIALYEIPKLDNSTISKIVNSLDKVTNVITLRKRQLQQLDELVKARFVELFGEDDYPKVLFEDVCVFLRNGANIKQTKGAGGYPITRIETLANDIFNIDRLGYADITDLEKYQSYVLRNGDILISHINSVAYLGRAVQYRGQHDSPIIHGMNLLCARIVDLYNPTYIEWYFKTPMAKEYISTITKKAVNQASITSSDLKKMKVPNPPKKMQDEFAIFVKQVDKSKVVVQKALDEAQTLFDSLMQEYFG